MTTLIFGLLLALLLLLSATYSGSETGVYSLSRLRLEADASSGQRGARLLRALVRQDSTLLIALLVGNNLMLELATHLVQGKLNQIPALPEGARELLLTLLLTPLVFVLGELFPKDLFRRRPHQLLSALAPVLWLSQLLLLPLVFPLRQLSKLLERMFGLRDTDLARALRREEVLDVLSIGTREGRLPAQATELARNVMVMRELPVFKVMLPWEQVVAIELGAERGQVLDSVRKARFTRLPALAIAEGGGLEVQGYLHQLDVLLAAQSGEQGVLDFQGMLRPLPVIAPELSVERALKRMRTSGQRIALVGRAGEPLGLVSLMDLLATITGRIQY